MARNVVSIKLANSGTLSEVAQGGGLTPVGIYLPSGLTGTSLTFVAYRMNGQTSGFISDGAGSSYTKTVASAHGDYLPLSRDLFDGVDGLAIKSGTTQSGDCTLQVVFN